MATKVRIKNLGEVFKAMEDVFKNAIQNKSVLKKEAKFVENRIRAVTRTGKTMADNKTSKPLPNLKESTIMIRRKAQETGKPRTDGRFFSPEMANNTFTGELLKKGLGSEVKGKSTIAITISGTRKDGISNEEVYDNLVDLGRDFIGLDKNGLKQIAQRLQRRLRREIRKVFK